MIKFTKQKSQQVKNSLPTNANLTFKFAKLWDFWGPIFVTFSLYAGIKCFIGEARYIPSGSMLPTLQINDRLVIEKLSYLRRSPRRGEVVVFNSPYSFNKELIAMRKAPLPSGFKCAVLNFPVINFFSGRVDPACHAYIKRVIAIGGDNVFINSEGRTVVNSELIEEPYVSNFCSTSQDGFNICRTYEIRVPPRHVFVLGDNRPNSLDGRSWGSLPESEILGRAVWRFWPLSRIGEL